MYLNILQNIIKDSKMLCCLVKWYDDNFGQVMDIINPTKL